MTVGALQGFRFTRGGNELGDIIVDSINLENRSVHVRAQFNGHCSSRTLFMKEVLQVPDLPIDVSLSRVYRGRREPLAYLFLRADTDVRWVKQDYRQE